MGQNTKQEQIRVRICAYVTEEQRDALKKWAAGRGNTWGEWCRQTADDMLRFIAKDKASLNGEPFECDFCGYGFDVQVYSYECPECGVDNTF